MERDRDLPEVLWEGKTPYNCPLVDFQWRDIRCTDRWTDDSVTVRPARDLHHGGWLIYDGIDPHEPDAEIVIIANDWDGEEQAWHTFTVFPKQVAKMRYGSR